MQRRLIKEENENLPDIYSRLRVNPEHTLESYKVLPGTELAVKAVKGIINGERKMLLIYGGVGNGKTHLLHAISINLYKKGQFARVYNFADMLNTLKNAMNNKELNYNEILDRYCLAERLIIDDIGAGGSDSEFSDKILEQIIVTRYGRELLTVMATNREIKDLPERVQSRLKDKVLCYLVLNKASDYRETRTK